MVGRGGIYGDMHGDGKPVGSPLEARDPKVCACGHVWDEHADELACTVENCGCIHFEEKEYCNLCDDPFCDGNHPG
jgi:hypothetical protein